MPRASRSYRTSTCTWSPCARRASPVPIWPTCSTKPPCCAPVPCPVDRQPRHRRGHRPRSGRTEAQVQGHGSGRAAQHRIPRGWSCAGGRRPEQHRSGDQGDDSAARPRPRLHRRHADLRPLLAVAQPAARPDGLRDGRSHRRGNRLPRPDTGASNDIEKLRASPVRW